MSDVDVSAYDEYFDGLTGAERNRELKGVARPRQIQSTQAAEVVERHWFIRWTGLIVEATGWGVVYVGKGVVWIGRWIRGEESLSRTSNSNLEDSP